MVGVEPAASCRLAVKVTVCPVGTVENGETLMLMDGLLLLITFRSSITVLSQPFADGVIYVAALLPPALTGMLFHTRGNSSEHIVIVSVNSAVGNTVTLIVAGPTQAPVLLGVKVYIPDAVLLTTAGVHVPLKPLIEVAGSIGAGLPSQNGAIGVKLGVIWLLTVMPTVTGTAQGKL